MRSLYCQLLTKLTAIALIYLCSGTSENMANTCVTERTIKMTYMIRLTCFVSGSQLLLFLLCLLTLLTNNSHNETALCSIEPSLLAPNLLIKKTHRIRHLSKACLQFP